MSLRPQDPPDVPEETRRVAQAAFRKGTLCLRIADALGTVYQDSQFAALFPRRGQPAAAPGRLALAVVSAVRGEPVRPRGGRRRARADRLETCARLGPVNLLAQRPDRPRLRPHRAERVLLAPGRGRRRAAVARHPSAAPAGAGPGQGARSPAHGRHARARRGAHAEPAGARRRDDAGHAERAGDGRAGLAASRGSIALA